MAEPVTTKILKLDLDPGSSISSSNKKDKKVKKKPAPQTSTSIIDSILKMKNSAEPANKSPGISSPAPAKKKKLIIDMSNDSHIIAEEKPASQDPPGPVIKPLFAPVKEKPVPTLTLKAEEQKRGKTPELNPESSKKLNTMLMLDNLFPSKNPDSANLVRDLSPPPYPEPGISITKPATNFDKSVSTVQLSQDDPASKYTASGLEEINAQIKQVRAKLIKKPGDPKYTDMLAKLEAKQAKYMKKLTKKPEPVVSYSPAKPSQDSSIITEIDSELNKTQTLLDKLAIKSPDTTSQPPKYVTNREPGVSAVFAVPNELASMKERKLHLMAEQKKLADKLVHRQKQIDRIKSWQREVEKMAELQKEKQKIFDLQRDLKKLEKQQYLQDQHLKHQLYTIKKQSHEKSLELKRQDVREYKTIREAGLNLLKTQAPHPGPPPFSLTDSLASKREPVRLDLAERHAGTMYMVPEQNSGVGLKLNVNGTTNPGFISRLTGSSFFSNLGKIKVGERVFFNKPAGKQMLAPGAVPTLLIPETVVDKKTGLEFFTADVAPDPESSNIAPVVDINKSVISPVTTGIVIDNPGPEPNNIDPEIKLDIAGLIPVQEQPSTELTDEEIIEKAKQLAVIANADNTTTPSPANQHEAQVSKEIMSSKLGILSGDTGLDKILTLATNGITTKTEKLARNACLLNMYKDITDAGILVC